MSQIDRFQKVSDLFEQALSVPQDKRGEFLRDACEDVSLVAEVERLLSHHDDEAGVLEEPIVGPTAFKRVTELTAASDGELPQRIGRYLVRRKLGAGGMGVVYLAEQENPRRDVAVKVIRPGFAGRDVVKRFDLEATILGRLKHPGIAQIHEAGTHDDGSGPQPFFAMEYVDGAPLFDYARDQALDLRSRLETFAHICDAVEHAHQRGVIHRDLKPGNVLVDAAGQPKVLDFGVARATASDLQVSTMHTDAGQLIGTVAYMSPEQVLGRAGEIDTRSDVYALGIMLYELISDRLPYDLGDRTIAAAARVISEQEPTSLTTVSKTYRGDLDTITRKALEKEPARRYQSAAALAADIRRYLNDVPIVARPASTIYQLRKFARRNRGLVFGVAAAFVALLAGAIVAMVFAIGQTRALAESERQRAIATAVNDFLTKDLIQQVDPQNEPDREITLQAAIDRAAEKIEGRFEDAPIVEASLRRTIGAAYRHLNRLDDAERQLTRALELYESQRGEHDEDVLLCRMELASVMTWRGDYAGAERVHRDLIRLQRQLLGNDHTQTLASLSNLGVDLVYQGKHAEAEPILEEALAGRMRVLGEKDKETATTLSNLGSIYRRTGRLAKAEDAFTRALAVLREVSGDQHPQTLNTWANLGTTYGNLGQYDEAADALEKVIEIRQRVLGEDHRDTLKSIYNLAITHSLTGQREKSEELLQSILLRQKRILGEDHGDTLNTRIGLAKVAYDREDYETAAAEYGDVVAKSLAAQPGHFRAGIAGMMQGTSYMNLEQLDRAEQTLLAAYQLLTAAFDEKHPYARQTAATLGEVYTRWEKPEEAERWKLLGMEGDSSPE